jgi:hypothetical protein
MLFGLLDPNWTVGAGFVPVVGFSLFCCFGAAFRLLGGVENRFSRGLLTLLLGTGFLLVDVVGGMFVGCTLG